MSGDWFNWRVGRIEGLDEEIRFLDGKNVEVGLKRGLKKVGNSIATRVSARIREKYNLKKKDVDDKFTVIASADEVRVRCQSGSVNLTYFGAKQLGAARGKRVTIKRSGDKLTKTSRGKVGAFGGVTVPIEKTKTTLLYEAFLARINPERNGGAYIGVFMRTSRFGRFRYKDPRSRKTSRPYVKTVRAANPKARQKIVNKAFVSASTLFLGKETKPLIDEYLAGEALGVVLHEVDWAMRGDK